MSGPAPLLGYNDRRLLAAFPERFAEVADIVRRVGVEVVEADILRSTLAAREADLVKARDELETLRDKVAARNAPPPAPYATWDEHDDDQADKLRGELRARSEPMRKVRP